MFEEWGQIPTGQIAVFIDGGSQNGAAMFFIPIRIIRSSAEKGDAKWGPADNHKMTS
jgi:hypothetical protein